MTSVRHAITVFACVLASAVLTSGCGYGTPSCGGGPVDFPFGIAHGPQVALASDTSMVVAWRTDRARVGAVEFGMDASYGTTVTVGGPRREHVALLDGLTPETTYHYRVLLDGEPAGGDHWFRTAPDSILASVRFAVVGDSGSGCPTQLAVAEAMNAADPDLVLHTGDVAYDEGRPIEILAHYFRPYMDLLDHIPFYVALGNHDYATNRGAPLLAALHLPRNDATGTERFYSFDRGPCHFVALDSNQRLDPESVQHAWLVADLAASTAPWTIVYFHHSPYSTSRSGGSPRLAASLGPVFEAEDVDVVFGGHDHVYQRTYPMVADTPVDTGQEPDYVDPGGPVYVVTGGGGRSLYSIESSPFLARGFVDYHFVLVDVTAEELTLRAITRDGVVRDLASIRKDE